MKFIAFGVTAEVVVIVQNEDAGGCEAATARATPLRKSRRLMGWSMPRS